MEHLALIPFVTMLVQHYTIVTGTHDGNSCQSDGSQPHIHVCETGNVTSSGFIVNTVGTGDEFKSCQCTILVTRGNKLSISPISEPGFSECGSEIHLQKIDASDSKQVIKCQGGTTLSELARGDAVSFSLYVKEYPFDASYCYKMNIEGEVAPSMTITCTKGVARQMTTTTSTTQTTPIASRNTGQSGSTESTNKENESQCDVLSPWLFMILAGVTCYSIVVTLWCLLSRRTTSDDSDDSGVDDIQSNDRSKKDKRRRKRSTRISRLSSTGSEQKGATKTNPNVNVSHHGVQYIVDASAPDTSVGASNPSGHWNMTYETKEEQPDIQEEENNYAYINETVP